MVSKITRKFENMIINNEHVYSRFYSNMKKQISTTSIKIQCLTGCIGHVEVPLWKKGRRTKHVTYYLDSYAREVVQRKKDCRIVKLWN